MNVSSCNPCRYSVRVVRVSSSSTFGFVLLSLSMRSCQFNANFFNKKWWSLTRCKHRFTIFCLYHIAGLSGFWFYQGGTFRVTIVFVLIKCSVYDQIVIHQNTSDSLSFSFLNYLTNFVVFRDFLSDHLLSIFVTTADFGIEVFL